LRAQYATWLGWLIDPDVPIIIVRNPDQDPADILWPALAVGYTGIAGELAGGIGPWIRHGGHVAITPVVGPSKVDTPVVLDIRQAGEYAEGHLPGANLVELGDLTRDATSIPQGPVTVMCGHGERAATGASLLERAGHADQTILVGGPDEWAQATGRALVTGR
jgi:rhodanese-related sulfurtransferase